MVYLCLYTFTIFSSFPIIVGDISQRTAVEIYQLVTDGEQFVKRIVHGEKISDNPGYLLFTAPYKLCEGGCKDGESNFAMAFPIYVGKKGKDKYKELYDRDSHKIHNKKPNAPFKTKPTKKLFTLCPSEVTLQPTTVTTSETLLNTETDTLSTEITTTNAASVESEYESTNPETEKTTVSETIKATVTSTETLITDTISTVPETDVTNSETKSIVSETGTIVSEIDANSSEIQATETPTSEKQTISNTETTMTETPTLRYTIDIPTTLKVKTTSITNALTVPETITVIKAPTKVFTAKTPTISKTVILTTDMPKTDAPTTIRAKTIITEVPAVPETDLTTIEGTHTIPKTESRETIQMSETNLPEFTGSQVTETEDITFEDYTDTTDAISAENDESDYVTNANGVRCPPRICQKKTKVTPKIITLVPYDKRAGKLDTRYAEWNSDYSDLLD